MVNGRLLAPADIPPAATPTAIDLAAPTTPAASLPAAPTPAFVELPVPASNVAAEYPVFNISWFSRLFAEFSGGVWMQGTGLSVNGAAPVADFGGSGFALRAGSLLTRLALPSGWTYETAVFLQGEVNLYDNKFADIYAFGGGIAPQFVYPLRNDCVLILAPDVMAGVGILWSKAPVDVGIPDKLYWASESYAFPELAAGLGVYLDMHTSYKNLSFTTGVHGGGRWYWHNDVVTNLPAGMPSGSTVSLVSPMWDVVKLAFGFRF